MSATLTRLQPGMRVLFAGREHVVTLVNECRAKIVPAAKRIRSYIPKTGKNAGKLVQFAEAEDGHNISPNAELPILRTSASVNPAARIQNHEQRI